MASVPEDKKEDVREVATKVFNLNVSGVPSAPETSFGNVSDLFRQEF